MNRKMYLLALVGAAVVSSAPLAHAQQMSASPIVPGFWSFPQKKPANASEVEAACRNTVGVQLADGHYTLLAVDRSGTDNSGRPRLSASVVDSGLCKFDPATQVERCQATRFRNNQPVGVVEESRFAVEPDGSIKMSVSGLVTSADGTPRTETAEVFAVKCPDSVVFQVLGGTEPAR